jgi:hypothetical protein
MGYDNRTPEPDPKLPGWWEIEGRGTCAGCGELAWVAKEDYYQFCAECLAKVVRALNSK